MKLFPSNVLQPNKMLKEIAQKYYEARTKSCVNEDAWKIATHTTDQERVLLFRLASELPSNSTIVEIGSYLGASTCFLAAGCRNNNGHVYAVDTWQNHAMSEGLKDTFEVFQENICSYQDLITPIRSFSVDAAQELAKPIHLFFVDGDHSYEGVVADLRAWLPKMEPNSWLLLHDWGWAEGVKQAIKEIVEPIQVSKPLTLPNLYAVRVTPNQINSSN
jgi:predicted O-methyltransferase YrrM